VRTNHRDEVFRYRILTSPETRRLFLVYLDRVNRVARRAEFYHLLSNSCTVNIVRYANASGREGGGVAICSVADRPVLLRHSIDCYQPAVCGTPATREDQ
jgi:hypothetical protein